MRHTGGHRISPFQLLKIHLSDTTLCLHNFTNISNCALTVKSFATLTTSPKTLPSRALSRTESLITSAKRRNIPRTDNFSQNKFYEYFIVRDNNGALTLFDMGDMMPPGMFLTTVPNA